MTTKKAPSLELICSKDELRPTMCHVYLNEDHAVATNGTALVRYNRGLIDGIITNLPKEVYVSAQEWKKLTKPFVSAVYADGLITVTDKKGSTQIVQTKSVESVGIYPNYKAVLRENLEGVELSAVGLNAKKLMDVQKAMNFNNVKDDEFGIKMHFDTDTCAIMLTVQDFFETEILGLLMTKLITDAV
jgi:hypothetical protein